MNERKRGKNRKKKLIIFFSVSLVLIITAVFLSVYFRQGEWEYTEDSEGSFGADTYYGGGYGETEVTSPGIYIRYTANVKNNGTMIVDIRETIDGLMESDILTFADCKPIETIEIKGNDEKEIYISSDDYSTIVISEYTIDCAEADTRIDIGTYITNWQKLGRRIAWYDYDGKYEKILEKIFDYDY